VSERRGQYWRDTFQSFVARKTRAALTAVTPPYLTEIDSPDESLTAIGSAWSRTVFGGPFYVTGPADRQRPACSLVFVQSADGNTVADDPAALGGGETDQHVVYEGLSRVAADAILAGAATMRGGGTVLSVWHPGLVSLRETLSLPRHPVQVIATLNGVDVERGLLFNVPEVAVIILTGPDGAATMEQQVSERPWIRIITMQRSDRFGEAFHHLRKLGISRISCIGGRTLANQLVDLGLIDDIYLTTSPKPGGHPDTPLDFRRSDATAVVRKRGTGAESGVQFEQFHFQARPRLT
jgi:5-amino-6-(5-phosphoribosylamino)uracil reductase